jgi:catechol 2,3-dioxygenase-like lactoylglutathione lyase family enzyme
MKRATMAAVCGAALAVVGLRACARDAEVPSLAATARACEDGDLSCPRPIYSVDDLAASLRYYRDSLGFRVDWTHGEPARFASVTRGGATLFLCDGCPGQPGAWSMSFSPDVDRLHDELRRRGAIIRMAPTDMPWGLREMNVADPDGNILRIGTGIDEDDGR